MVTFKRDVHRHSEAVFGRVLRLSVHRTRACRRRFAPTHSRGQTNGAVPRYRVVAGGHVS